MLRPCERSALAAEHAETCRGGRREKHDLPESCAANVMTPASLLISELRSSLAAESGQMARDFAFTGDGRAAVAHPTRVLEDILKRLWRDLVSADEARSQQFTLLA